jgi:hypothetical protein
MKPPDADVADSAWSLQGKAARGAAFLVELRYCFMTAAQDVIVNLIHALPIVD